MNSMAARGAREAEDDDTGNETEAAPGPPFDGTGLEARVSQEVSERVSERGSPGVSENVSEEGAAWEAESPVNYDEAALLELELDGTEYRLDVGRAGTALCISTRLSGSWSWVFRSEARWQAGTLRCKAFDRPVLSRLSTALAEAPSSQS
jgi:hypothetical protein